MCNMQLYIIIIMHNRKTETHCTHHASLGMTQVTNSISREEFLSLLNNQTEEFKNIEDMINNYTQGTTSSM